MSSVLDAFPLLGIILSLLLILAITCNAGSLLNNNKAKGTLIAILIINAHYFLDSFFVQNDTIQDFVGLSYIFFDLIGPLFLIYTYFLFKIDIKINHWLYFIVLYTISKVAAVFIEDPEIWHTNLSIYSPEELLMYVEKHPIFILIHIISSAINIFCLGFTLFKLKQKAKQDPPAGMIQLHYQWIKGTISLLLILSTVLFIGFSIIDFAPQNILLSYRIESLSVSLTIIALVYYSFRFPIFAPQPYFKTESLLEKSEEEQNNNSSKSKYENSNLTEDKSQELWLQLNELVKTKQIYQNPECRIKDLADALDTTVHRVSQSINEQSGVSFSDFINQYRIEAAKELLLSDDSKKYTILALAFEVGFNSKTTFYNAFKKHTNQTPSEFKKMNQVSK